MIIGGVNFPVKGTIICKKELRQEFDQPVIQRSGRLHTPKVRTTRFKKAFVPMAVKMYLIQILNDSFLFIITWLSVVYSYNLINFYVNIYMYVICF